MADEEGNFALEKLTLDQGSNEIIVWAEDEAGNKSEQTDPIEIVFDATNPELNIEAPEDKIAVEDQILEVRGTTESSARVLVNNHIVVVDEEGKFVEQVTLQEGRNEIRIVCQDRAGNEITETRSVTYLP